MSYPSAAEEVPVADGVSLKRLVNDWKELPVYLAKSASEEQEPRRSPPLLSPAEPADVNCRKSISVSVTHYGPDSTGTPTDTNDPKEARIHPAP